MFDIVQARNVPTTHPYVGRATMPLPPGFKLTGPKRSPFQVGQQPTNWHPVTYYPNGDVKVCELVWAQWDVADPDVTLEVHERTPALNPGAIPADSVGLILNSDLRLEVFFQNDTTAVFPIAGDIKTFDVFKAGNLLNSLRKHRRDEKTNLGLHTIVHLMADGCVELNLMLETCGALSPSGDLYLKDIRLRLPEGWAWSTSLPDILEQDNLQEAHLIDHNVRHYFPQGMTRCWRGGLVRTNVPATMIHAPIWGTTRIGWTLKDRGGYLAQGVPLPSDSGFNMKSVRSQVNAKADEQFHRWRTGQSQSPAYTIGALGMWPVGGTPYGGMTGGVDVEQFPGVDVWLAGERKDLLEINHERYMARQPGMMFTDKGEPHVLSGSPPKDYFNFRFKAKRPFEIDPKQPWNTHYDDPYNWDRARAEQSQQGSSDYKAQLDSFDPIDYQHLTRATKDAKALVYLANDEIAKLRLSAMAHAMRHTWYEGQGGKLAQKAGGPNSLGDDIGRGEAWCCDLVCTVQAYDAKTFSWADWIEAFDSWASRVQMASGVLQAQAHGKQAVGDASSEPNAHSQTQKCKIGVHLSGTDASKYVADFYVGRSNEHIFLMHALRAISEVAPHLSSLITLESAARCMRDYLWVTGKNGPHARYIAAAINARQGYSTRQKLEDSPIGPFLSHPNLGPDNYHVASSLGYGYLDGVDMDEVVKLYTGKGSIPEARAKLAADGIKQLDSRAVLIRVLQDTK